MRLTIEWRWYERVRELEDRSIETIQSEKHRDKKDKNNEQGILDIWDSVKGPNIHVNGVPEGVGK